MGSFAASVSARECIECKKTNARNAAMRTKAAACKRAQSTAELNINNVRALINGYGNMWYDGSIAQYHLPKNSNTCPLFCAALWIGGTDVNDQLRIAALRFGSEGDDYWPGPLKVNGTASIDLPTCNLYDHHYIITKSEVLSFMEHFEYSVDSITGAHSVVMKSDPGDDLTEVIRNWPAHGDGDDLTGYLAPFYDADDDGIYNPQNGDYPYYDFNNDLCPRTIKTLHPDQNFVTIPTMEEENGFVDNGSVLSDQVLKGDQTIWWVFNDMGNTHTETNGQPIGLEIRAQAFAFSTNDRINDMTFYSYEIINRSTYELRETYFSQWVDPDLGYAHDDFIGCDVRRGLGYCYNGDEQDGPGSGSYSGIPPAVGIDFFQGPYMDADGKDNPKINIPWIEKNGSAPLKQLLSRYKRSDGSYDTIDISYHADEFFAVDPNSWYFVPGDAIGNCAINGVNFGNNIIDDERFGMRRFVYYQNSSNNINGEPTKASDYYNYLRGYWKNGARMKYGGNGYNSSDLDCDFMFPYDSDPWHWGTNGLVPTTNPNDWNEIAAQNEPGDRRFMQSAGPFTLKPGALNYITVGIPFAQASNGNAWASVDLLRQVDDICQRLFENCFKVLDGPDAPTLTAQELANEVILYLSYENPTSNNYGESYSEVSPSIPTSYQDDNGNTVLYGPDANKYKFEGYQIYQLKDANTSIADIDDPTKAILVAQCDIENYYDTIDQIDTTVNVVNGDTTYTFDTTFNSNPSLPIGTLVNYTTDTRTGILTGKVMVEGENAGIRHVFRITKDQFASGVNTNLVNNKEYYFVAIAYAQNRYREYSQTEAAYLDGQKEPYLAGRRDEKQRSITPITVIPHSPAAEAGGKMAQSEFGMSPNIIRLGGYGNGGSVLRLSQASIDTLMGLPGQPGLQPGSYRHIHNVQNFNDNSRIDNPCIVANPLYEENYGPVAVHVIDPLAVREGRYNLVFANLANRKDTTSVSSSTRWGLVRVDSETPDTTWSDFTIGRFNEQLFLDLGIAVSLVNPAPVASELLQSANNVFGAGFYGGAANKGALLASEMTFSNENIQWLSGVPDNDSYFLYNWIRSGTQFAANSFNSFQVLNRPYSVSEAYLDEDFFRATQVDVRYAPATDAVDKDQVFESVVQGMWSPYALTSTMPFHPAYSPMYYMTDNANPDGKSRVRLERELMVNTYNYATNFSDLNTLPSVHVVFTADTSKWTRCPVIEQCDDYTQSEGNARRFSARRHASVNKLGLTRDEMNAQGISYVAGSVDDPAYISDSGMGWFPGYAINTNTGERLNMMFGEDSRYVQHHGRDMLWNPVSTMMDGTQNYVIGGRHYVYVMNATRQPFFEMLNYEVVTPEGRDTVNHAGQSINYNSSPAIQRYVTPSYDAGRWAMTMLRSTDRMMKSFLRRSNIFMDNGIARRPGGESIPVRDSISLLYASVAWVNMPLVNERYTFENPLEIPCDVTVDIDIRTPYGSYLSGNRTRSTAASVEIANHEMPAYQFIFSASDAVIENIATRDNAEQSYKDSLLSQINVVPNPYYSYSGYETSSQLETKVRIVNLPTGVENGQPQGCLIRIYTVDGTLVRTIGPTAVSREVSSGHYAESTTVDWDLHNQTGIPISGGMYLIHVSVPGIGERVIKWFGTMRPVDLNSFGF